MPAVLQQHLQPIAYQRRGILRDLEIDIWLPLALLREELLHGVGDADRILVLGLLTMVLAWRLPAWTGAVRLVRWSRDRGSS